MTTVTRISPTRPTARRRSGPVAIALAELRMLVRNRTVALCALLLPLGFAALTHAFGSFGTAGMLAGVQVIGMVGLGVYVTATTTLAARRQSLHLKRLRSGSVGDAGIIAGLVLPVVAISVAQLAIVLGVLGLGDPPAHAGLLVAAVVIAEAMFAGFALATAGFTTSPEHAQYTTMPLYMITLGVAIWWTITGADDLLWLKRILPGGGLMELLALAWNGGDQSLVPVLLAPTLVWAALGALAATKAFRWEPRH